MVTKLSSLGFSINLSKLIFFNYCNTYVDKTAYSAFGISLAIKEARHDKSRVEIYKKKIKGRKIMTEIKGTYNEKFERVREILAKNLESGADIGASVAVFIDGEAVVDIWGGYFDE